MGLNREIFVFTAHFVPCKLSLDDYESRVCKPCDCCFVSMNSHFLFALLITIELTPCWNTTVQQCDSLAWGKIFPRDIVFC
jgi:hypothetical protein